eukprot:TRINITY_DN47461_c0_g1_i1.p1 TRINITY_DN47461_c0_g1~~TRINITY_DN47461_c0_g1_i1.p1  ORF type:complete len:178 (+),score=41.55 TRINITY_DN47461_c0_g1_i1:72-605(+)
MCIRDRSKSVHRDPYLGSEGRHLVRSHSRGKQHHADHITDVSALTPSDGGRNGPTSSSMNTTTTDDGDGDVLSPIPRRGADGDSSLDDSTYYKLNPHQVRINKRSDAVAKKRFGGDQGPQDVVDRLLGLGKRGSAPQGSKRHNHHPPANEFLSLIHISEPTRLLSISYAVFCLKKKK